MEGRFSPSCQSRSWNVWAPHPGPPALCPSPAAECFSSTFCCLNSNISLLYLDAEHLLEQVTICVLVLTFLVETIRQQWSVPKPVGMASEGGKPGGWGCVLRDPAISQTFESTCDVSVWARGWTEAEEGESIRTSGPIRTSGETEKPEETWGCTGEEGSLEGDQGKLRWVWRKDGSRQAWLFLEGR